jgi:hypothetical protein
MSPLFMFLIKSIHGQNKQVVLPALFKPTFATVAAIFQSPLPGLYSGMIALAISLLRR